MNFMRSMVKEIEALTDSAVHVTRQSVEGVAQAGKDTVEGISQLANSALDEATAALETVSNMGEATLSLISNTMRPSKRRFHPLKPNIMRCACIGDSGVGKSTLLATWREGRYPAGLALPSTIYDWLYFNYCLSSKSLLLEHLQQHRERKANDDNDNDDELLLKQKKTEMEIAGDAEKENMKQVRKEAEEVVTTVEAVKERREIVIEFLDTAGEYEGFRHLRPWHYKDVDVFILAFDLTNRASFANIARYWTEEIKTWGTSCVKILVGTKADIADLADNDDGNEDGLHRSERGQLSLFGDDGGETVVAGAGAEANRRRTRRKVEREEAEELAKRIEAVTYVEISSVTQLNLACLLDLCVAQVFEDGNDNEDQEASDKPSMVAETTVTTELTTTSEGL